MPEGEPPRPPGAGRIPPGRTICIVMPGGIGDAVHALALASALRRADPGCRLAWVVQPSVAQLLRGHPAADRVVLYRRAEGARGLRRLLREVAALGADWTINLDPYFRSLWPVLGSRAPERVGWGRDRARDGVWLASNHRLPPRPLGHQQDAVLEFAEYLGVPDRPLEWGLELSEQEQREQRAFLASLGGRPVAAVVPASGRSGKDWLPERYAAVVDHLQGELGYRAVLVGGPGARETALARRILELSRTPPAWAMGDGVRRALGLIAASRLVVAPDTGALHLAQAVGTPVVGLYADTDPARFGPYRFRELTIDRFDPAAADPRPMERITVRDVLERIELARRWAGP